MSPARAQYVAGGWGGSAGPSPDHGIQSGGGGFVGGGNPYQGGSGGGGASDQAGSPGAYDRGGSGGHGGTGGSAGPAGAIGPVTSGLGSPLPSGSIAGAAGGAGGSGGTGDKGIDFGKAGRAGGGGGGGGGGALGWQSGFGTTVTGIGQQISGGVGGAGGAGGAGGKGILSYWIYMNLAQSGGAGGGGGGGGGGGPGIVNHGWLTIGANGLVTGGAGGKGGNGGISGISYGGTGDGIPTCTYTEFGVSCTDFPSLPADPGYSGSGGNGGGGGYGILGLKLGSSDYSTTIQTGAAIRGGEGGTGGDGSVGGEVAGNGGNGGNGGGGVFLDDGFWIDNSGTIAGGRGGRGGNGGGGLTAGNGGKGGDGGDGLTIGNGGPVSNAVGATISGGDGGASGKGAVVTHGTSGSDGAAGNGGTGLRIYVNNSGNRPGINNAGTIRGGNGGDGMSAGNGGTGLDAQGTTGQIVNSGTIAGGDAGAGGSTARGGRGLVTATTVINSGTIAGGFNADGSRAAAVSIFHSSLELRAGSTIIGDVLSSFGSSLALGGAQNSSFDLAGWGRQYRGFAELYKTGSSTWTLSNAAGSSALYTYIDGGVLAFSNGARLQTETAGTIESAAGSSAAVVVDGANTSWNVGETLTISDQRSGSLTVSNGGTVRAGSISVGTKTGGSGTISITGSGSHIGSGSLVLGDAGTGSALVSGAGSSLMADTFTIANSGRGTLTVANGGKAGAGNGKRIDVAKNVGSIGTINIGAAAGQAAAAPGTLTGDIQFGAGAGTLVFNHTANDYVFSSSVSGAGAIDFLSGTTIWMGAGLFTGTTTVTNSTLRMTMDAGLGGTLVIGAGGRVEGEGDLGATTVDNGGTLAPSGWTELATNGSLTVNSGGRVVASSSTKLLVFGTLTLNSGSNYDYQLRGGGSSSPGSTTTRVTGDLVLDGGTLNLASSSQPAIGYHRVFTYTGGLSDNGFTVGSTPVTSPVAYNYAIDTSQSGKVDVLVTTNGLNILQLWGTTPAGGASGVWNAANQNWFDLGGAVPAQWGSGYGIFRGPGGTVTVEGAQNAVGLQFAGGSYILTGGTGDSLNLHGFSGGGITITTPEIRVLAEETARIDVTITGTDGLDKTGDGTLILGGTNSYSGGTTISGGTLQISDDRNLGAASGGLTFDNGALHTTADIVSGRNFTLRNTGAIDTGAATTLRLNGDLTGAGGLIKWGDGTLVLSGIGSWTGGTLITAGTIRAESVGALPNDTGYVLTGGKLDLSSFPLSMSLLAGTGGEVALGTDGDLTVNQAEDSVFAGQITGNGGILTKAGSGTLLLTGTSTHSGGTSIIGGTLAIIADANLGAASAPLLISGATLATLADTTSSRPIFLQGTGMIETWAGTTFTIGGTILGDQLIKDGWGTLVLTGSAVHAGGTTIAAGMLQIGNGRTTGDLAGDVIDNAVLNFNRSNDYTFGGAISGSGVVVQSGTGTTTLTGANSYSGGTLIRAGILQVSNDGNLGASGTAVTFLGGTLRFGASFGTDRTLLLIGTGTLDTNGHDATLTGGVYGYGDLIKTGAGTLTLTGTNSYRNTVVEAGTLVGDATSISGNITANGTVVFDQRDDASLASVFSGTGRFTKAGGGTLELTGDSSGFSGSTTVSTGMLVVNGTLAGGLDVLSGARLQGSGIVGSTTIRTGGTIAPGNSIGTLTVAGDISFERGAAYEVEVSPDGSSSDLIRASGKASLSGGSVVHIGDDGNYRANQRYTILTAAQGVDGRFDDVASRYLFLDPTLDYDATSVTLTLLRNDLPFAAVAQTRNQIQTALGLESLGDASALWHSFTQLRDEGEALRAYDSLSGEIHASAKTAVIEGSQIARSAVFDRIRASFDGIGAPRIATLAYASGKGAVSAAPAESFALWARGFGSWGQTRGDGNAASLTRSSNGLVAGFDIAAAQDARIGITAGYARSTFEVAKRLSRGEADTYHIGLYAGGRIDRFRLSGGLTYAWHELSTRRTVSFPGFGETLRSGYDARSIQAFAEIAYRLDLGPAAFEPFANLAYVNLRSGAFAETGGAAALSARAQTTAVTFATLGLRAQIGFDLGNIPVQLNGTLGWRRAAGEITPLSLQAFAGGAPFSIAGAPIARDALVVGAGLALKLAPDAELALAYDGQLARHATDHIFNARLGLRF